MGDIILELGVYALVSFIYGAIRKESCAFDVIIVRLLLTAILELGHLLTETRVNANHHLQTKKKSIKLKINTQSF